MQKIILFTTDGCHLCERALDVLEMCRRDFQFTIQEVDIASDTELLRRYGTRIPVILWQKTQQTLFWPFDCGDIANLLSSQDISSRDVLQAT